MRLVILIWLVLICILQKPIKTNAVVEITNLVCRSLDESFSDFEYCYIKAINRTYKYISLKVNLFQKPITNISTTVAITKKENGYKPFLYNVTFDGCKFLRERKNPLHNYFYSFIKPFTNANHSCPYNHDLLFDKIDVLYMNNQLTNILPVPKGSYGIMTTWWAYNIKRAQVDIYFKLSN